MFSLRKVKLDIRIRRYSFIYLIYLCHDLIDMSKIYSMIAPLLGVSLFRILNEIGVNQSATSMANSAYAWLLTLNPVIVIVLGVIVFIASKFAKWIGIIMIIVGVILLALPYVLHIV